MTREARQLAVLALLPSWCALLLVARWVWSGHPAFLFLAWNLVLAAVPAVASTFLGRAARRRAHALSQAGWFLAWLLFLPNAPYIVTDFIHLHARPGAPLWFDIALFTSFAGTGLLLGYASTAEVQRVLRDRFGAAAAWVVVVGSLVLSGFGIYLGRFLRWNSWDVVADPLGRLGALVAGAVDPAAHPKPVAVTLVYGVGLVLGYVALRLMVSAERDDAAGERESRSTGRTVQPVVGGATRRRGSPPG